MARIFKRANGILYLEYEVDGKTRQRSTRLPDTKENRAFIKKEVIPPLEKNIILGELSSTKANPFSYYVNLYLRDKEHIKTYSQTKQRTDILNQFFSDSKIDNINRASIKDFVYERLKVNSPRTVNGYLSILRGIFNTAIDTEAIKYNPIHDIPMPKHTKVEIQPFTSEEVSLLLSKANEWYRLFLAISFYTGMRTGEVLALRSEDIDFNESKISISRSITKGVISTPKTASSIREVPTFDDLLPYLENIKDGILFPKSNGEFYNTVGGSKKREWKTLLDDCNIEYRKLYATRHTFIVSMLKNSNLSILEVAQIVGHTSTQMIIQNYGKFIRGEHMKIDRKISLFTDNSTNT